MAAGLLDDVERWPEMLEMVRDRHVGEEARKAAVFSVGRVADFFTEILVGPESGVGG